MAKTRLFFSWVLATLLASAVCSFQSGNSSLRRNAVGPLFFGFSTKSKVKQEPTYPESKPATYELLNAGFEFGLPGLVRPLMKQTQLENRKLQVVYDANKDGWDAKKFHAKVDGKGAAVVLVKVGGIGGLGGTWIGGYNPRGWASLGGSRPSIASFLFYKTPLSWQKVRVKGGGGMACGKDEYNTGIFFGADALTIPLQKPDARAVRFFIRRLGKERNDIFGTSLTQVVVAA